MVKKTQVDDIERGIYDTISNVEVRKKLDRGLTKDIVREISEIKEEPLWMRELRERAVDVFYELENPVWGPDLSEVDLDNIATYVSPNADREDNWDYVPDEIKTMFDKLGIPEAEKKSLLSGVGAQFDSEVVYHNVQKELTDQGVIFLDFDTALKEHEQLVKKYFQKSIPVGLHKYSALHYAVWSGGTFVYVPKGVHVEVPLQTYYRLNAPGAGQFEHTMIIVDEGASCRFIEGCSAPKYNVLNIHAGAVELFVEEGAHLNFTSIENWSRNMYNLNTKRAVIAKNGHMEWVGGSFGSKVSMLYPGSVLNGEGAISDNVTLNFAGSGQIIESGVQIIHNAPNTFSNIDSRSISKSGGISVFRSMVRFNKNATGSKSSASCESLMLDNESRADTIPVIISHCPDAEAGHEANIGRIDEEVVDYMMSRGLGEVEAKAMIVRGFADPISRELPLEYAVEMNNLINLELEGTVG
ncbi:MAG: Fe-S cluster assembly protein SufB [Ezakiella sp.]|nr:Fe-S cluster assembly protein SufB [Ezakiella sp.]